VAPQWSDVEGVLGDAGPVSLDADLGAVGARQGDEKPVSAHGIIRIYE
jgi:hypothetical protein